MVVRGWRSKKVNRKIIEIDKLEAAYGIRPYYTLEELSGFINTDQNADPRIIRCRNCGHNIEVDKNRYVFCGQ